MNNNVQNVSFHPNDYVNPSNIDDISKKYELLPGSLSVQDNIVKYTFRWGLIDTPLSWNIQNVVIVSEFNGLIENNVVSDTYCVILGRYSVQIWHKGVTYILSSKGLVSRGLCVCNYNNNKLLELSSLVLDVPSVFFVEGIEDFAKSIFACTSQRIDQIANAMQIPPNRFVMDENGFSYSIKLQGDKWLKVNWNDTLVIKDFVINRSTAGYLELSSFDERFSVVIEYRPSSSEENSYIGIRFFVESCSLIRMSQGYTSDTNPEDWVKYQDGSVDIEKDGWVGLIVDHARMTVSLSDILLQDNDGVVSNLNDPDSIPNKHPKQMGCGIKPMIFSVNSIPFGSSDYKASGMLPMPSVDTVTSSNIHQIRAKYNWSSYDLHMKDITNNIVEYKSYFLNLQWKVGNVVIISDSNQMLTRYTVPNKYYLVLKKDCIVVWYNRVRYLLEMKNGILLNVYSYNISPFLSLSSCALNLPSVLRVEDIEDLAKSRFLCTPQRIDQISSVMNLPSGNFVMSGNTFTYRIPLKNNKWLKVIFNDMFFITDFRKLPDDRGYRLELSNERRDFVCGIEYRSSYFKECSYINVWFRAKLLNFSLDISQGHALYRFKENDGIVKIEKGGQSVLISDNSAYITVSSDGEFNIENNPMVDQFEVDQFEVGQLEFDPIVNSVAVNPIVNSVAVNPINPIVNSVAVNQLEPSVHQNFHVNVGLILLFCCMLFCMYLFQ